MPGNLGGKHYMSAVSFNRAGNKKDVIAQAKRLLSNLSTLVHTRLETLIILVETLEDWHDAECCRLHAVKLHAKPTAPLWPADDPVTWNALLRIKKMHLQPLGLRQAETAPACIDHTKIDAHDHWVCDPSAEDQGSISHRNAMVNEDFRAVARADPWSKDIVDIAWAEIRGDGRDNPFGPDIVGVAWAEIGPEHLI